MVLSSQVYDVREGFEAIGATKAVAGVILGHFNMTWFCYFCASQMHKCDRETSILKNATAKCQWYMLDISHQKHLPPPSPFCQNLNNRAAFCAHTFIHTGSWFTHHSPHPRKFLHSLLFVTDTLRGPDLCSIRQQASVQTCLRVQICCIVAAWAVKRTNSNKIVAQH